MNGYADAFSFMQEMFRDVYCSFLYSFLQCFDKVGLVPGRETGPYKTCANFSSMILFQNTSRKKTEGELANPSSPEKRWLQWRWLCLLLEYLRT